MKKILSLLLVLVLLFCTFPLPVSGVSKGKLTLSGKVEKLYRTLAFDVEVELNRNPGIANLRATLCFDPKVLEVLEVEGLGILPGFSYDKNEDEILLRWAKENKGADLTARGKLVRIKFRVLEKAIYGDSAITLSISQKLYDATNSQGQSVPFDTANLPFTLVCPHDSPKIETVKEPSFEEAGTALSTCPDCLESKEIPLLPTLSSEDGKTVATLNVGEFSNSDEKSIRTEYIFGGEEKDKADLIFGDTVIRAFRIHINKGANSFTPAGECKILLKTDYDLPVEISLYALVEGGAEQIEMTRNEGEIEFLYQDMTYVLVSRTVESAPEIPPETTAKKEEIPTTTLTEEERQRRDDLTLICVGIAALVLCGAGAILLTRKNKRF